MASDIIGVGATRIDLRTAAALGEKVNPVHFEACESVNYGGVLFLLPFLLANGLLSYNKYYSQRQVGYYDFDSILLTIAIMYLCRIKNIEQLKHESPGEIGKLLGLDRVPEARCLRIVLKELYSQQKASEWGSDLAQEWINENDTPNLFYIDGHVKEYCGYLANLGKKHMSRQKLCLPGITEFWINNANGLPYFFISGEVNEKLQDIIENNIIHELTKFTGDKISDTALEIDQQLARYTLVFDREASSPQFFNRLWKKFRVAIITYKKNVKDKWDEQDFNPFQLETEVKTSMYLCEKEIEIDGVKMREIRKLNESGHQTSIVTTNYKLPILLIAFYMFARWTQENFFKYMRQEYDIDRIIQYGVDQIDPNTKVVNREYSNLTQGLKKIREKKARKQARLFILKEENIKGELEQTGANFKKQLEITNELKLIGIKEQELIDKRKLQPYKISISEMPDDKKYNKLKVESKHVQNIIKMICYRADTAFANLLDDDYKRKEDEKRALVKTIIFTRADLSPDYQTNTLTVSLYALATPRDNKAAEKICQTLNETETIYPGTNLKLVYKVRTG